MKKKKIFNEEQKLFMESAWLLYNNRDRILSNPCMAYAPVNMPNGLMYCGDKAFKGATIGVYLDWWQECEKAVVTDEDGRRSLIVCFGGSMLSGWNLCYAVAEDGTVSEMRVTGFPTLWHPFSHICHRYADGEKPEEPYCLEEVICRLTDRYEDCMKFINERLEKWK
jgi:hypothetical protein